MRLLNLFVLSIFVCSFGLTSCVTTTNGVQESGSVSKWLEPSSALREDIERQAERLPYTHNRERVELIHWFATVGEPAYPWLLELARDDRRGVAGAAISALGATGDQRLIEDMRALPWPTPDEDLVQALERARALLRLGDWEEIPVLIRGLESDRLWTRALCSRTLTEATNMSHGYLPEGTLESRELAIGEWKNWWEARSGDSLLEASSKR